MTAYSKACHKGRRAADLCRHNGIKSPGFSCLPAAFMGAIWAYEDKDSGLVILLNATGAVNQAATKAAADLVKRAAALAAAKAAADPVEKACAEWAEEAAASDKAAAAAWAAREGYAIKAPAAMPPAAFAAMAAAFALAPIAPALESPLFPLCRDMAAAILSYGRGAL